MIKLTHERAWQRMLSGRRLDLLNPTPLDIEMEDIAHGLSRMSRWNGQTIGKHIFSVAAHSLLVEAIFTILNPKANKQAQLYCLLHDAPEYVIGDLISPFKNAIGGGYRQLEDKLLMAIHLRFGLPAMPPSTLHKKIKRADLIAAAIEAKALVGFTNPEIYKIWGSIPKSLNGIEACNPKIYDLPNWKIKALFMKRVDVLDME